MPTTVFVGGRFTTVDDARVSAFDAGFQHGVGLFETLLGGYRADTSESWAFRLHDHMRRLERSSHELGLARSLSVAALEEAVLETVRRSQLPAARVRMTITAGDLNMLTRAGAGGGATDDREPTLLIVAQPATSYPAEMFQRGVSVVFADTRANPLNAFEGHKTLNYWWRLRELQIAAAKGAGEAIVLQVTNHVCGGCVSNLMVVHAGKLLTPIARGEEGSRNPDDDGDDLDGETRAASHSTGRALPSPVLPGVTRAWVIDWAERHGIDVQRRMLSVSDIMDADEVFLTNSSWGVLPVTKVEAEATGDGVVGPVSSRLVGAWRESITP
jgi:branched-subunit amino acid aminotransferase/4-amino-4-deoxychorismate lyase